MLLGDLCLKFFNKEVRHLHSSFDHRPVCERMVGVGDYSGEDGDGSTDSDVVPVGGVIHRC